jgi:hypothetical protein
LGTLVAWAARLALVGLLFSASDPVRMAAAVLVISVQPAFQRAVLAWDQRQQLAVARRPSRSVESLRFRGESLRFRGR